MIKRLGQGVAGAALLIGAITILGRVTGFGKQLVFARTVGTACLSTAYYTANQIPNLVFEIVVGGALAGMVVPVLAGRASRDEVSAISSALLTWVLLLLIPLSLLTALLAGPVVSFFVGDLADCDNPAAVIATGTRMLVVFAPQIVLYGIAVVLYGVLQAHRRFASPALAPLVSSVVVIVAYLAFVPLSEGKTLPGEVPEAAELALSVGTTLGVVALVVTVLGPTARLRLRWRPTLRFPAGVGAQVRTLALAGLSALVAQQVAMAVVVILANRAGSGQITAYNYAWAIYLVPYAVLAVPIATSAFPVLSARAENGDRAGFAALAAQTTRVILLISGLAAGALAATAAPIAAVFLLQTETDVSVPEFARAIALFAPGLLGYGLMAHLSRVLYAEGHGRPAARAMVTGWLIVIAAQTAFSLTFPQPWKLGGLALGQAVGMTAGGLLLLLSVRRAHGPHALTGVPRAGLAALLGGITAYLAGSAVVHLFGPQTLWPSVLETAVAGLVSLTAGTLTAAAIDRGDLLTLLDRTLRRKATRA
ncbi:lipid II flippase MurJ [Acrocarpospora macrocephala]|uniref:Membrane protein n=1 Tax=Acrocarpospora macrocephala TaxID=150177 RepID=A0A5M3X6E3_9ACTN|nr:lipid II flippase MurJ [Acrocarpospora macrocephala]GES15719.1 membrane protein [Acrocarpospora macrocephala]